MYQSGDIQCRCSCQSDGGTDQFTHPTGNMQRIGVQLYTDKRNGRDELWMDTCNGCRYHTGRPTSGTGDPNETLTNTTAAPITVRYVYTLAANGCTNPSTFNVDVVVNPMATLTSSLTPPAICSGSAFSYTPTSGTAGTSLGWTRAMCSRYHTCWTDIRDR